MTVIADWLDVTYSPDDHVIDELTFFLSSILCNCSEFVDGKQSWFFPTGHGCLIITTQAGHVRVSASGGFLDSLRQYDSFQDYIALLSSSPNRVTRLDAAYDVLQDAPPILAKLLKKYPDTVNLGRQRPLKVKYILGSRDSDGLHTGTVYAGHRSRARVTARVYDKQEESLVNRKQVIPPTTRYEITIRGGLAGLRDAFEPTAIFWSHVGDLLVAPSSAPAWVTGELYPWAYTRPTVLPAIALQNRVRFSSELDALIAQADSLGIHGRKLLLSALRRRVEPLSTPIQAVA